MHRTPAPLASRAVGAPRWYAGRGRALLAALVLGAVAGRPSAAQTAAPQSPSPANNSGSAPAAPLRVCGDPDNLPFSNEKQEGFENKIADLIAHDLGTTVQYLWWPHRRGFVRSTLRAHECDVLIGVPRGFDPVAGTQPYYRSTYYFVHRADRKPAITSLDDPALRSLKVAVNIIGYDYTNTPPAHALGVRGIQAVGFSTFYGEGSDSRPQDIVDAVAKGDVDVAIVWGPLAGFFAKHASVPLTLSPLPDEDVGGPSALPFAFDIVVGVRRSDKVLKARIDSVLVRRRADVQRILADYGVPTLPITPSAPPAPAEKPPARP